MGYTYFIFKICNDTFFLNKLKIDYLIYVFNKDSMVLKWKKNFKQGIFKKKPTSKKNGN